MFQELNVLPLCLVLIPRHFLLATVNLIFSSQMKQSCFFFFSLQIMDFFFPTDCYKSLSDKSLIFCKAKTCSSACGCYSFVLQNVWPRLLVPQLCIVQHKFWYSSTPLRSFFALLGGFDWWKAVCVKKTALCVLVFLLGKSYRVIHLQLKCSVRTVILFFFWFWWFLIRLFWCGIQNVIWHLGSRELIPEECAVPLMVLAISSPSLTASLLWSCVFISLGKP